MITKAFDDVRSQVTGYLSKIRELETNLSKSRHDCTLLRKDIAEARKEIENLTYYRAELIQEKEDLIDVIEQYRELADKDKKNALHLTYQIEDLTRQNENLRKQVERLKEEVEKLIDTVE